MNFDKFLAEVKSGLKQYDSAGLIDELSVMNWVVDDLNSLSILPTIRIEYVLNVKNNKATLPEGFKSLYSAVKCEPFQCTIEEPEEDKLIDFYYYKVRELKNQDWNFCEPCDIVETESCIVERTYLHNGTKANFYYNNLQPVKLKLTTHVKRAVCDKDCINLSINSAPNEISINGRTIYTNFKEGSIFIVYNGYEYEDGMLIIPDTKESNLKKYLLASIKRKIIGEILTNSDNNSNEQFLYSMYLQEENDYFTKTMGELKLGRVLKGMKNYERKIKNQFEVYDFGR